MKSVVGEHNQGFFLLFGIIIGILLLRLVQSYTDDLNGLLENLASEAIGIIFTVVIIDRVYRWREDQTLRKQLLEQLGSQINSIAVGAAERLWANGWWSDGSLSEAQLERADLRGADFGKANLTGVRLSHPRYGHVKFDETTILPDETHWSPETDLEMFTNPEHPNYWRGSGLRGKTMIRRNFERANLRGSDLRNCDLRETNLKKADLRGARMEGCRIEGADLADAMFDERTILPDNSYWTANTDLSIFRIIN